MLKLSLLGVDPTTQSFGPAPFLVSHLRGPRKFFSTWTFFPVLASGPLPSLFLGLGLGLAASCGPFPGLDLFPTFSGPRGLFWGFCRASGLFWFSGLLLAFSGFFCLGASSGPFLGLGPLLRLLWLQKHQNRQFQNKHFFWDSLFYGPLDFDQDFRFQFT